jgi:hypothetical protein
MTFRNSSLLTQAAGDILRGDRWISIHQERRRLVYRSGTQLHTASIDMATLSPVPDLQKPSEISIPASDCSPSLPTTSPSIPIKHPYPYQRDSHLARLPRLLSHFVGFRPPPKQQPKQTPPPPHAAVLSIIWSSIGAFLTILGVAGITRLIDGEASVVGSIVSFPPPLLCLRTPTDNYRALLQ